MKTSKIILITFFGIIGLFLLSLTIQVKPRIIEAVSKSVSLPQFRHLVVNSSCNLTLSVGSNDSIRWIYKKNTNPDPPSFSSKGDTLFINWQMVKQDPFFLIEVSCNDLESVTVSESTLKLNQLKAEKFQIIGNQCNVNFRDHISVDSIAIDLENGSNLSCSNSTFRSANIKLLSSQASFYNVPIDELTANIRLNSVLSANQVLHANVSKDFNSKYSSQ